MKHLQYSLLLLCLVTHKHIQANNEPISPYQFIDEHSLASPDSVSQSINDLATYLQEGATNETELARSIYVWITHNIHFDLERFEENVGKNYEDGGGKTLEEMRLEKAQKALQQRKGVCMGYATLFKALCDTIGIDCYVIIGKVKTEQHAWNAINIDDKWHLVDATWGAGKVKNGKFVQAFNEAYFLADPTFFLSTHLPNDPTWQLLKHPLSHKSFEFDSTYVQQQLTKSKNAKEVFSFTDTIAALQKLPRHERDIQSAERAYRYGGDSLLLAIAYRRGGKYFLDQGKGLSNKDKYIPYKQAQTYYQKALPLAVSNEELTKKVKKKIDWFKKMEPYFKFSEDREAIQKHKPKIQVKKAPQSATKKTTRKKKQRDQMERKKSAMKEK